LVAEGRALFGELIGRQGIGRVTLLDSFWRQGNKDRREAGKESESALVKKETCCSTGKMQNPGLRRDPNAGKKIVVILEDGVQVTSTEKLKQNSDVNHGSGAVPRPF